MSKLLINSRVKIFIPSNLIQTPRAYNLVNYLSPKVDKIHIVSSVVANNVGSIDFSSNVTVHYLFDLRTRNFQSYIVKIRFKIARILLATLGIETHWALGYGVKEFLKATKNIEDETIFCFKEIGLLIGNELIKKNKK